MTDLNLDALAEQAALSGLVGGNTQPQPKALGGGSDAVLN